MKLKKLEIELQEWGSDKGKYAARIRVGDDKSDIYTTINSNISSALLVLVVDELVKATEQASVELKQKLLECLPVKQLK